MSLIILDNKEKTTKEFKEVVILSNNEFNFFINGSTYSSTEALELLDNYKNEEKISFFNFQSWSI
jgi:hypothetical protein